jgi:hypothetical protein
MSSFDLHLTRDSSLSLHGFTDVDWAGSIDNQKSTSGYIVFLSTTPIHGNLASNALLLAPPLKPNIRH